MYPQLFGKYVLERELARGGMARVVLATLRGAGGFEKRLVVKQIRDELACDEEFVRRFVEEAKTTVALAHPNIVPVYELGVELGTYFLVMEYVEGASLAELLRASRAAGGHGLSPEEGAYVGVEVCRALDYAHRRMNVVHRDVTPRNVMVDEEGQVKVIDFGISAPVATAPSGHEVFGSPGHMPPEQIDGKELTPAADVFAVAVLLMELWSDRAPFRRRTSDEIDAAMHARHPRASETDARLVSLDAILGRSMSLDPLVRPQHADELSRELRRFLTPVDLGDVARQLGERVRQLRANPPPRASDPKPLLQRPPSRPTATQAGTKTFAAREGLEAPADAAPSTRKLKTSAPPPSFETARTRPLESASRRRGGVRTLRLSSSWWAAASAGALAVAALWIGHRETKVGMAVSPTGTTGTPAGTAETVSPLPAASDMPAMPKSVNAGGADAWVADPTGMAGPLGAAATAGSRAFAAERAQLVALGDGTLVTVDGVPRGRAPARLAVEPGAHTVMFLFPPTGESKADTVVLRAGERATVSADFTGVAPTIRVRR